MPQLQTITIMRGLPASGKTTLARDMVQTSGGTIRRVNLDDIRAMLAASPHHDQQHKHRRHEDVALAIQDAAILEAIEHGFDVVVDNTHLAPRIPNRIKRLVAGRARFEVHDLTHVPIDECIRRDARRAATVGAPVIKSMADRIKHGRMITTEYMNDWPTFELHVANPALRPALIVDLDGTLAIHVSRGPYELKRCEEDAVNANARQLILDRAALGWAILLVSGRNEAVDDVSIRELTQRWLDWHEVPFDHLWMRAAGDQRPDYIVKGELFDKHIRGVYDPRLVLDDRDSVVGLWRRGLGLPCWQVGYGNF
jgi:predicted kinase